MKPTEEGGLELRLPAQRHLDLGGSHQAGTLARIVAQCEEQFVEETQEPLLPIANDEGCRTGQARQSVALGSEMVDEVAPQPRQFPVDGVEVLGQRGPPQPTGDGQQLDMGRRARGTRLMRLHVALAVAFPTITLMLKADHPP